jgi:hypothetical protein
MRREALLPAAADHWRIVGGTFAGTLVTRHCYGKARVFGSEKKEEGRKAL